MGAVACHRSVCATMMPGASCLCLLVSGDYRFPSSRPCTNVKRALQTNADLTLTTFRSCIIVNGIEVGATRPDLDERTAMVNLRGSDRHLRESEAHQTTESRRRTAARDQSPRCANQPSRPSLLRSGPPAVPGPEHPATSLTDERRDDRSA